MFYFENWLNFTFLTNSKVVFLSCWTACSRLHSFLCGVINYVAERTASNEVWDCIIKAVLLVKFF